MAQLESFDLNELMLFIIGVLGALGGLILAIQKSKCEEINCCCFKCKRNVQAIIDEEKLKLGKSITPRKSLAEENKKLKLELQQEAEAAEAAEPEKDN